MKKNRIIKAICFVLACACTAMCVVACGNVKDKNKSTYRANNKELNFIADDGEVKVKVAKTALNERTDFVTYTVSAVVEPSDAENLAVDWSIAWSDDAPLKESAISEHLILTPLEDGGRVATVKCIKAFRGSSAIITATSRDSGVQGTCTVTYSGLPSAMQIDLTDISTQKRGNIDGVLQLKRGSTYTKEISLSNVYGDVGEEYKNYTVKVIGVGSFVKGNFTSTTSWQKWNDETEVTLDSVKNNYLTAKITDGKLVITAIDRYENMRGTSVGGPSGGTTNDLYKEDKTDADGNLPYYRIEVFAGSTGVNYVINAYVVASVTSVTVGPSIVTF